MARRGRLRGRVRFVRVKGCVCAGLRTKDDASKGKKPRGRVAKSRISIYSLWIPGIKELDDEQDLEEEYRDEKRVWWSRMMRRM